MKLLSIALIMHLLVLAYSNGINLEDAEENLDDPFQEAEAKLNSILFGSEKKEGEEDTKENNATHKLLAHYVSGQVLRAELFQNISGVHLPSPKLMHPGHCYLQITKDHMQTAINAFSIFLKGTVEDVLRLPPMYVLRSARTLAMMKVAREKLAATWRVVKGNHGTEEVTHQTLEMYRPLFKYINGREMARLNLSDSRILSYIGTHADLDRHQVGVVASKYIRLNKNWDQAKYLNLMNNLLCGVPMIYMRAITENTYLQLSNQVLGKANSWSASDVARLGLLLTEVDGPELSAINPQALKGITAQVMLEMAPQNLKYLTETQLRHLTQKSLNILAKKLLKYEEQLLILNSGSKLPLNTLLFLIICLELLIFSK